ncbi:MAG: glycosyltransferase family 4 protein [Alphaproteobacteria bacterium]|nr:glycosyltransferase family 4 protein [Alphaproteobacteria bacterium]
MSSAKTGATKTRAPVVLQVLPALVAGGVERGTVEIAAALRDAGWTPLVASAGGPMQHEVERAGATHFTLPLDSKNPLVMYRNVARLAALIEAHGIDILHARSRAPAWSAFYAAKRAHCHFVTTFHGTYSAHNWAKRHYNAVMTKGERVIAISEFIAGHMRRIYGVEPGKLRVIPRGVKLDVFDPARVSPERIIQLSRQWQLRDDAPVILLPGRLTRWKGQRVLIEALAALGRKDVQCRLAGSDQGRTSYRKELEQLIVKRGLSDIIKITDNCKDMPAAYMLADVVVSASTDPEAFGRVVAEAQAMGRPVVATDHGAAQETVLPGETGWLSPPGDAKKLAEALAWALGFEPKARDRLAARAREHIVQHYSNKAMCKATLNVYREVLGEEPVA